jgi:hypothetical protein
MHMSLDMGGGVGGAPDDASTALWATCTAVEDTEKGFYYLKMKAGPGRCCSPHRPTHGGPVQSLVPHMHVDASLFSRGGPGGTLVPPHTRGSV